MSRSDVSERIWARVIKKPFIVIGLVKKKYQDIHYSHAIDHKSKLAHWLRGGIIWRIQVCFSNYLSYFRLVQQSDILKQGVNTKKLSKLILKCFKVLFLPMDFDLFPVACRKCVIFPGQFVLIIGSTTQLFIYNYQDLDLVFIPVNFSQQHLLPVTSNSSAVFKTFFLK